MTNYVTSVGVQQFSITIASGNTSATATINAVGSLAFIIFGGINPSVLSASNEAFTRLTLTNSTTITATRNTGTSGTVTVTGCIIDATSSLIKSIQYGTVTIANSATSGTASISAVTNANTAIHYLGHTSTNTSLNVADDLPTLSLSGTTVTATRGGAVSISLTVSFVVIEFQGAVLNQSVQNVSAANASNVSSWTATITSVNTSNTLLIYAGARDGTSGTNPTTAFVKGVLTNGTTVTVNSNTGNAAVRTFNCSVVELVAGVLNSAVQRGTTTETTGSNTSTITSVSLANSAISWLGNTTSITSASLELAEGLCILTNATTVTVESNTSPTSLTGSWEVWEFPTPNTTTVDMWQPILTYNRPSPFNIVSY